MRFAIVAAALAATLSPSADDPAASLVAKLRSPVEADRDAAADALDAIGPAALPALRSAASGSDSVLRPRAEEAIARIGSLRLLRGSPVSLDARGHTLAEVASALAPQAMPVILEPAADPRWAAPAPEGIGQGSGVPFWEAVARLESSAGVEVLGGGQQVAPQMRVTLQAGPIRPSSWAGPYRLRLNGSTRDREVVAVRPPAEPRPREEFRLNLELDAEPGIALALNGPFRLIEAIDDRGRDLRPTVAAPPAFAGVHGSDPDSSALDGWNRLPIALPLRLPADRGSRIARVRGSVPIVAKARLDEWMSLPLDGRPGPTASRWGTTIQVTRSDPTSLELLIRGASSDLGPSISLGPHQRTLATIRPLFLPPNHLRIEDAAGRAYIATMARVFGPAGSNGSRTVRLDLRPSRPDLGPPARLRYFGLAAEATEVPFDFRDLPIP